MMRVSSSRFVSLAGASSAGLLDFSQPVMLIHGLLNCRPELNIGVGPNMHNFLPCRRFSLFPAQLGLF